MTPAWLVEVLAFLCVLGAGFSLGVGWAIHRAVGWVERMRAWAASVPLEESGAEAVTAFVPAEAGVTP